jgi:hypothetical protein
MDQRIATLYTGIWIASISVALFMVVRNRAAYSISQRGYIRFLAQPWKLVTFVVSAAGLTLIAPYTGDPTWDYVDAATMSLLTFATAPWTVAIVYRVAKQRESFACLFVAANAWLFSASWSYDGYLLLRDGQYPSTWLFNWIASSVLYVLAGLFWNLEWIPGRGVVFAFMQEPWPNETSRSSFVRVAGFAALLMLIVSLMIGYFVVDYVQTAPR